jgi:hypothetical protein
VQPHHYAAIDLGYQTFTQVLMLASMCGAKHFGLWLCTGAGVFLAIVSVYTLEAYAGRIFRALPDKPPKGTKAAIALGIVILISFIQNHLGRLAFWTFSRAPWVVLPEHGRFMELQGEATATVALIFAIIVVALGLDLAWLLGRLVLWLDLPNRY